MALDDRVREVVQQYDCYSLFKMSSQGASVLCLAAHNRDKSNQIQLSESIVVNITALFLGKVALPLCEKQIFRSRKWLGKDIVRCCRLSKETLK